MLFPFGAQANDLGDQAKDEDAAYWAVVLGRAGKIVEKIDVADESVASRVTILIASQYRDLNALHEARDASIAVLKSQFADKDSLAAEIAQVSSDARLKVFELHYAFLARLSTELNQGQVEQVKDGMTYGVVPLTYGRYLQLLPDLEDEHKRWIYAALIEAREHAMDEGSSDEKHRRFGKYKGRINNYLSTLGVDMKEQEMKLAERERRAAK